MSKVSNFVSLIEKSYPRPWEYWPENDINRYLDTRHYGDHKVSSIGLCITPPAMYDECEWWKEQKVDLMICHHPTFTRLADSLPIIAAHTRADRGFHDDTLDTWIGINELWAHELNLGGIRRVQDLYALGHFKKPCSSETLQQLILDVVNRTEAELDPLWQPILGFGAAQKTSSELIHSLKICSGAGGLVLGNKSPASADRFDEEENYADAFLTGECCGNNVYNNGFKTVIQTGHTLNERLILKEWRRRLLAFDPALRIVVAPVGIDTWCGDPMPLHQSGPGHRPKAYAY